MTSILLVGANPGLLLYDDSAPTDKRVAFVAMWRVDWSPYGAGRAVVLWHGGRTRLLTDVPGLGWWLAEQYTRHFPEVDGLPWPEPELTRTPVVFELDLAHGVRVAAGDVIATVTDPIDRRIGSVESFPGNGLRLSNVYVPCRAGTLSIGGRTVQGAPQVADRSSSAFLAEAEVWSEPGGQGRSPAWP